VGTNLLRFFTVVLLPLVTTRVQVGVVTGSILQCHLVYFTLFTCTLLYCLESVAGIEKYVVPDNTPIATLQLSANFNQGRVAVKAYGNRNCDSHPNGTLLNNLDEQHNYSNPAVVKIQAGDPEFVFSFIYIHITLFSTDICVTTTRLPVFADKKYHAHFEFDEGWCDVKLLTLINEGTDNESWRKYLFAKTNNNICIDKSDLNLLKRRRLR